MDASLKKMLLEEGVDLDGVLDRLSGDEDFYLHLLASFLLKDPLKELQEAIFSHDQENSSRDVHTLKGVTLNLGLVNLAEPCITMLQLYRQGEGAKADALFPSLKATFSSFNEKISPYLKEEKK